MRAHRSLAFQVSFEPSNENALLFAAILRAQTAQEWSFPDGAQALATYLGRVDREADRLRAHIEQRLDDTRATATPPRACLL